MRTFAALVVDDEAIARRNLRSALEQQPRWSVAAEADSGEAALEAARNLTVDVVFLDVQMPGMLGLRAAREMAKLSQSPLVVFVTAYDQYAVAAFDLCAVDYLLKPFDDERLGRTLQRVEQLLTVQDRDTTDAVGEALDYLENPRRPLHRLLLRSVGSIRVLPIEEVLWLSSAGNYVEVHHREGTDLHRIQLVALEARLPRRDFVRVHRSAILRVSAVREIRTVERGWTTAVMTDGREVRVSARYRDALIEALET
ncbi:MAG: LytTR family DNA-binding domain-containing protein [Myxococcota bacterium]